MSPGGRATRAMARGLVLLLSAGIAACERERDPIPDPPPDPASQDSTGVVSAELRHIRYHVAPGIVLRVEYLTGEFRPTGSEPVTLDDPGSFSINAQTATIAIPYEDLTRLLNDFVFKYEGSNLSKLEVKAEDGRLRQDGVIHKVLPLPFTILAEAGVTEQGMIRLHPVSIRVAGIPAGGLLDLLGVELDGLIRNNRAQGVRVEDNDLILDPAGLLPPPRLLGRLTGLTLGERQIFQRFGPEDSLPPRRFPEADATLSRYMFLQHAILRFGRLTMTDAWMLVVDDDQSDWFDFSLDRYHEQLVAGYHETTDDDGLVVHMPDLDQVQPPADSSAP